MFSMCSELTPCARIPDTRIPQLMQPWSHSVSLVFACICLSMNKATSRCRGELLLDGQDGGSSAKAPKAAPGPVLQP